MELCCFDTARLGESLIRQEHVDGAVTLHIGSEIKKADGQVAACYLIFYSIGRFVIEFFRGDIERGSVGVLSTSQFISIFTTVAGIILLLTVVKKQKQEANISLNSKG